MPAKWLQERADGSKYGHGIVFEGPGVASKRVPDVDSSCRLLIVPPFRGSSNFESLILSHHAGGSDVSAMKRTLMMQVPKHMTPVKQFGVFHHSVPDTTHAMVQVQPPPKAQAHLPLGNGCKIQGVPRS